MFLRIIIPTVLFLLIIGCKTTTPSEVKIRLDPDANPNNPTVITYGVEYWTAECRIGSNNYVYRRNLASNLKATKLEEILSKCKDLAVVYDPRRIGISNLTPHGKIPTSYFQGTCHTDDDTDFSLDQFVVGKIVAPTLNKLKEDCRKIAKAAFASDASSGLTQIVWPEIPNANHKATCHIDDDPDFDYSQVVYGEVRGFSLNDLKETCKKLAKATYGYKGSAGIIDIKLPFNDTAPFKATCHVDDDSDFNYNQTVLGDLSGNSLKEVFKKCESLAETIHPKENSAGLKNLEIKAKRSERVKARCYISEHDGSLAFNSDHFTGEFYGRNLLEVQDRCQDLASLTHGMFSKAGLSDPTYMMDTTHWSKADCWLDDDPDFDYDQFNFGTIYSTTYSELGAICKKMAKEIFGNDGTSGLQNVVQGDPNLAEEVGVDIDDEEEEQNSQSQSNR